MLRADNARVEWDKHKKRWEVHIYVGAETIKRPIPKLAQKAADSGVDAQAGLIEALKLQAVEIGKDEGYDLDPAQVSVIPNC